MKNVAIVTGASSGIGREFVKIIDKNELFLDEIWLLGTNKYRLKEISDLCSNKTRIISLDLSSSGNLLKFKRLLNCKEHINIRILVNAAGFGIDGSFRNHNYRDIKDLLRVNIEALTSITYNCLDYMSYGSRIINIASSAGFLPQPYFTIYAASKAYVLNFSRGLREELKDENIFVTAVCPGPVETRFFNKLKNTDDKLSFMKKSNPYEVAIKAYRDSLRNRSVSIYGYQVELLRLITKTVPHDIIVKGYKVLTDVTVYYRKRSKRTKHL